MTEVIYAIQVSIAVVLGLWAYNHLAKRWTSTLGDDVVSGYVNDVVYVATDVRCKEQRRWCIFRDSIVLTFPPLFEIS